MARWFFGFISHVETEYLLESQPPGTFLIRFSKSNPGSFALGFRMNNAQQPIMHILIKTVGYARRLEARYLPCADVAPPVWESLLCRPGMEKCASTASARW